MFVSQGRWQIVQPGHWAVGHWATNLLQAGWMASWYHNLWVVVCWGVSCAVAACMLWPVGVSYAVQPVCCGLLVAVVQYRLCAVAC